MVKLNRYELVRQFGVHQDFVRTVCVYYNENEQLVKDCLAEKDKYLKVCRLVKWQKQLSSEDFEYVKTLSDEEATQFVRKKTLEKKHGSLDNFYKEQDVKRKTTLQKRYNRISPVAATKPKTAPQKKKQVRKKEQTQKKTREENIVAKYGSLENFYKQRELKRKKTLLDRYGDESYHNLDLFQKTISSRSSTEKQQIKLKRQQTMINRFGENYKDVLAKRRESTNLERYGCKNAMQNKTISEKARQIQNEKYGQHREVILAKSAATCKQRYGVNNIFKSPDFCKRFPGHISSLEKDLQDFVKTLNIDFRTSVRDVISCKDRVLELDIYIPEKSVAIELDGLYWHSELYKAANYHQLKTDACNAKGIRLLHIFSDDWTSKRLICESIIKSSLGIYEQKVFARKCQIKDVNSQDSRDFLEQNHIQGAINSSIRKGLYYNGELLQIICLGKSRFKHGEYELYRMCTKLNTQVVGGFSKLLASLEIESFVTYVDLALFTGKGYYATNFTFLKKTKPNYWYLDKGCNKRLPRLLCQKHKLKTLLGESFDPNLTEVQNMHKAGYVRFFDSGNFKLIWRRDN